MRIAPPMFSPVGASDRHYCDSLPFEMRGQYFGRTAGTLNQEYIYPMRMWVALAIALSFCLQSWATTWVQTAPCPMESQMRATMAQAADTPTGIHADVSVSDCCSEMDTYLLTGQACKTGQDCQATFVALPQPMVKQTAISSSQSVPALFSAAVPHPVAVAVWRPPTTH